MPSAKSIDDLLIQAAALLNRAAGEIRDAPLRPTSKNIGHVAEALSQIFEVQLQIHALHPELAPGYMNEPTKDPSKHFEVTLQRAKEFEALGETETAVAFLKQFIAREPGAEQCALAEREISRIEGKGA
jgi:hypothetical protein